MIINLIVNPLLLQKRLKGYLKMKDTKDNEKSKSSIFNIFTILIAGGVITAVIGFVMPKLWPDNKSPEAKITATPTSGKPPLTVLFDALKSSDPEGKALSFTWKINGDEINKESDFTKIFKKPNTKYAVSLTVKDEKGLESTDSVIINVTSNIKSNESISDKDADDIGKMTILFNNSPLSQREGKPVKIGVKVQSDRGKAVTNAYVQLQADGGTFEKSGSSFISGRADSDGKFFGVWRSQVPGAGKHKVTIIASKHGFSEEKKSFWLNIQKSR